MLEPVDFWEESDDVMKEFIEELDRAGLIMRNLFLIGGGWVRTLSSALPPYIRHRRPQLPSKQCGCNGVDAIWPNTELRRVHASITPCCYLSMRPTTVFPYAKREGRRTVE